MLDLTDSITEILEEERRKGREQVPLKASVPAADPDAVVVKPAPKGDAPIDRIHLARYTLGDVALENEVLGLFAESLPQMVEALAVAADATAWRNAAHSLKGSARAIGAWSLADAAAQAEKVAPGASARSVVIEDVRAAARRVEEVIERDRANAA